MSIILQTVTQIDIPRGRHGGGGGGNYEECHNMSSTGRYDKLLVLMNILITTMTMKWFY